MRSWNKVLCPSLHLVVTCSGASSRLVGLGFIVFEDLVGALDLDGSCYMSFELLGCGCLPVCLLHRQQGGCEEGGSRSSFGDSSFDMSGISVGSGEEIGRASCRERVYGPV